MLHASTKGCPLARPDCLICAMRGEQAPPELTANLKWRHVCWRQRGGRQCAKIYMTANKFTTHVAQDIRNIFGDRRRDVGVHVRGALWMLLKHAFRRRDKIQKKNCRRRRKNSLANICRARGRARRPTTAVDIWRQQTVNSQAIAAAAVAAARRNRLLLPARQTNRLAHVLAETEALQQRAKWQMANGKWQMANVERVFGAGRHFEKLWQWTQVPRPDSSCS